MLQPAVRPNAPASLLRAVASRLRARGLPLSRGQRVQFAPDERAGDRELALEAGLPLDQRSAVVRRTERHLGTVVPDRDAGQQFVAEARWRLEDDDALSRCAPTRAEAPDRPDAFALRRTLLLEPCVVEWCPPRP
jgi:hypothetical protein